MSHINKLTINNYRGVKHLCQDFGEEKFIILIGRGDSGKSTILSAIHAVLSPSWNMTFSDLDFYNQNTSSPIEIEAELSDIPHELLVEKKFGLYVTNDLIDEDCQESDLRIRIKLSVDESLEPRWVVKARSNSDIEDKVISAQERALFAINFITDYTDNQFSYNKLSPLYSLTKASLGGSKQIDQIKSKMLRTMSSSLNNEDKEELNKPLGQLKTTSERLGLSLGELSTGIDIKENPYTGNSIALHEKTEDMELPFRLHGKGSKRLMSIAIQIDLAQTGGIALIDEIEQGLEPDRIATLVRLFRRIDNGQMFITTHSVHVILEAEADNIFILNKDAYSLCRVDSAMDSCRRSNPQAFFGKKLIICEGKTECGFLRAMDSWNEKRCGANFSTNGVVVVDAGGGNKMYTYAIELKRMGYDVCVFADNDVHKELSDKINAASEASIPLFLCREGHCLEKEIITSVSWNAVISLTQCDENNFPTHNIELSDDRKARISNATSEEERQTIREEIIIEATKKNHEWFKHIPGGEFLGNIVLNDMSDIPNDNNLKKNIIGLTEWCGFEQG